MFDLETIKYRNLKKALERNFTNGPELIENFPEHIVDRLASLHDNTKNVQYLEELADMIHTYANAIYHNQ